MMQKDVSIIRTGPSAYVSIQLMETKILIQQDSV